jgi:predicted CoA-binding protein
MPTIPSSVADFLAGKRIVVAGVSRTGRAPANAIFRRFQQCGYEAVPLNPNATELEGARSYPVLSAVPGPIHGLLIASHPATAAGLVREAATLGVRHVWFHRSFGSGSVSPAALDACRPHGIEPIVGGCPLMYCQPVDPFHRCMRWWLRIWRRIPG